MRLDKQRERLAEEDLRRLEHHIEGAFGGTPYVPYVETEPMDDGWWESVMADGWDR